MNTQSTSLYIETVTGIRRLSNFIWASLLLIGTSGFLLTGLSSYFARDLIPFIHSQSKDIMFTPQGLVMCFYGTAGLFLSAYLWFAILLNVGGGYNEFDYQKGVIFFFRWGFPGKNRIIRVRCFIQYVQAVRIETNQGIFFRHVISLRLKNQQNIPFNQVAESLSFKQIEQKAAQLARFLQVPIESL